ncbi:DPP10 peptidase, partial [Polypterus senegalus]
MAAVSVFQRVRTGSKLRDQYDQEGNIIQVETREDEEQNVKLAEILELLLAAGYFRARIKGLSSFDKWLVKRAIETREEMGDYIRAYSISQFQKSHSIPEEVYKPQRKYKRQTGSEELTDEESRVHSTLLEYGRRYGFSKQAKQDKGRLTASTVGQIVGLQSHEIKQIVSEYAEKLQAKKLEIQTGYGEAKSKLAEAVNFAEQLNKDLAALEELESQADSSILLKLRSLVAMNESLKNQEQEFRTHCREEMLRLQQSIENLKIESGDNDGDEKVTETAMASSGAREQFLRQMEQIVEGIKQNRIKMEKKKQENKMRRDQLNDEYLELLEKQRLYFKTVKDFKELAIYLLLLWYLAGLSSRTIPLGHQMEPSLQYGGAPKTSRESWTCSFILSPAGYHRGRKRELQGGPKIPLCPITRKSDVLPGEVWELNPPEVTNAVLQYAAWGVQGQQLIYIFENNIYYQPDVRNSSLRLTDSGKDGAVFNGIADWLYEGKVTPTEEILHSHVAHWWSPDGRRLAFLMINDSLVPRVVLPRFTGVLYPSGYAYPYPKAGQTNPSVKLYVVKVQGLADTVELKPPESFKSSDYYITMVKWINSNKTAVRWLDRNQKSSLLAVCDVTTGDCVKPETEEINVQILTSGQWEVTEILAYDENQKDVTLEDNANFRDFMAKRVLMKDLTTVSFDGYKFPLQLTLPANFNEKDQYPLLLMIDGAPGSQTITEKFHLDWDSVLSSSDGVIVAQFDGSGSGFQGLNIMRQIYQRVGVLEVHDYLKAIQHLFTLPFIDNRRTAIYGKVCSSQQNVTAMNERKFLLVHGTADVVKVRTPTTNPCNGQLGFLPSWDASITEALGERAWMEQYLPRDNTGQPPGVLQCQRFGAWKLTPAGVRGHGSGAHGELTPPLQGCHHTQKCSQKEIVDHLEHFWVPYKEDQRPQLEEQESGGGGRSMLEVWRQQKKREREKKTKGTVYWCGLVLALCAAVTKAFPTAE